MQFEQYELIIKSPHLEKNIQVSFHVQKLLMKAAFEPGNTVWLVHRSTRAMQWIHRPSLLLH